MDSRDEEVDAFLAGTISSAMLKLGSVPSTQQTPDVSSSKMPLKTRKEKTASERHNACASRSGNKSKAYSLLLGKVLAVGIEADPATVFGLDARRLLCFNHSLDNLLLNTRALSPAEMPGSYRAES